MSKYTWKILEDNLLPNYKGGLPPVMLRIMAARGILERDQAEEFLYFKESLLASASTLPDIDKATERVVRAILNGEKIVVYGDFDADGVTATAIMTQGLKKLNAKVSHYIPDRFSEGYGMNIDSLERIVGQGASLIISVDNGISSYHEVQRLNELGVDTIITDHHSIPERLPEALAIVNPHLLKNGGFKELSGAGVAFKFISHLLGYFGRESEANEFFALAAIGTIADIMPLLHDNRYLAEMGLRQINKNPSACLKELIMAANLKGEVTADRIGWVIAPRINAAGRLQHADIAYDLLTCQNQNDARLLARELEQLNAKRQDITATYVKEAQAQVDPQDRIIIFESEGCPKGEVGLVAGRLCEEFWLPAVAINTEKDICTASCRSVEGFNITEALSASKDLLLRFGGHEQAAGFSISRENIPALKQALNDYVKKNLDPTTCKPTMQIDSKVGFDEISLDIFKQLKRLEPFGEGNPAPTFLTEDVEILDYKFMGKNSEHMSFKLAKNQRVVEATAFNMSEKLSSFLQKKLDIVYNLEINEFNGRTTLRANIIDFEAK